MKPLQPGTSLSYRHKKLPGAPTMTTMKRTDGAKAVVREAENLVHSVMAKWDASHDASHALRVRSLALSLADEENLPSSSILMVELAALLHDIGRRFGDHKHANNGSDSKMVEHFLEKHNMEPLKRDKILRIIANLGYKDELSGVMSADLMPEFGIVQDADRLDAIGAIGIARCFAYGGSRDHKLYDPEVEVRMNLTKEEYIKAGDKSTSINHFHEKLLKLKDLMKTEAGKRRAERRHKFMEDFLKQFHEEWEGNL